jgi:hypothetical protein
VSADREGDRRVPAWLRISYAAFVAVLVPVYLHHFGPTNFLYYCDVALLLTLAGVWLESPLLVSMSAVGVLLPQAVWISDFVSTLLGRPVLGMTAYMFDDQRPLYLRGLSLFHGWLPIVLIWLVRRLGYDRRAFAAWTALAWVLMPVCFFLMPAPGSQPPGSARPVNINYVYGFSDQRAQTGMPPLAYFWLLMAGMPLAVFLPAHVALRWWGGPIRPKPVLRAAAHRGPTAA